MRPRLVALAAAVVAVLVDSKAFHAFGRGEDEESVLVDVEEELRECAPLTLQGTETVTALDTDYMQMGSDWRPEKRPGLVWGTQIPEQGTMWGPQASTTSPNVIRPLNLIFCAAAKVGSTTWRQLWRTIDPNMDELSKWPGWHELALRDLGAERSTELLNNASWTKAAFVRDPAERLLSAYLNKIANMQDGEGSLGLYRRNLGLADDFNLSSVSFGAFVDILSKQKPEFLNIHWNSQALNCDLGKFLPAYNFIGCFESVSVQSKCLLSKLRRSSGASAAGGQDAWAEFGANGNTKGGRIFPPRRTQSNVEGGHMTQAADRMAQFYTAGLLEKVRALYAEDYRLFGVRCGWDAYERKHMQLQGNPFVQ